MPNLTVNKPNEDAEVYEQSLETVWNKTMTDLCYSAKMPPPQAPGLRPQEGVELTRFASGKVCVYPSQ